MNIVALSPWNWLKRENDLGMNAPVRHSRRRAGMVYDPFYEMDRFFNALMHAGKNLPASADDSARPAFLRPSLDVTGDEKQYVVTVELPGVNENDLRVEMENDSLRIFGEKKQEFEDKGEGENSGNYYRMERSYGSFQRVLTLPEDVDTAGITADHKDGVLTITLPRKEAAKPENRTIAINKAE